MLIEERQRSCLSIAQVIVCSILVIIRQVEILQPRSLLTGKNDKKAKEYVRISSTVLPLSASDCNVYTGPRSVMDNAFDFESKDCGFESHRGHFFLR